MTIDVSTLQLVVDSRQVKAAKDDLAALTVQGATTEKSLAGIGTGLKTATTELQAQINQAVSGYAELSTAGDASRNRDLYDSQQVAKSRTAAYAVMFDSIIAGEKETSEAQIALKRAALIEEKLLNDQMARDEAAAQAYRDQRAIEDDATMLRLRKIAWEKYYTDLDEMAAASVAAQKAASEAALVEEKASIEARAKALRADPSTISNGGYPQTGGYVYSAEEVASQDKMRLEAQVAAQAYRDRGKAASEAATIEETAAKKVATASSSVTSAVIGSGNAIRNQSRIVSDASSGLTEALTGQYGRVRRSIAGMVNASGLLNSVFTAQGVAVALTIGGIGLLTKTAYDAVEAESELEKSIIRTNYAAGQTADQVKASAAAFATQYTTYGQVIDLEKQLAASGIVTTSNFKLTTQAAIAFGEATGQSGEQVVRVFADIEQNPLKTLEKLNQLYGNITPATLDHVKALQDESDKVGAANLAYQALYTSMTQMASAEQAESTWLDKEIAKWHQGAGAIKEYYSELVNGPSATKQFENDFKNYTNDLAEFQRSKGSVLQYFMRTSTGDPLTAESLEKERVALVKEQYVLKAAQQDAANKGYTTDNNKAEADANAYYDNHFAKMDRNQQKLKELVDLTATYKNMWDHNQHGDNIRLANVIATVGSDGATQFSGGQYDKDVEAINQKYKTRGGVTDASTQRLDQGAYSSQLADVAAKEKATFATLKEQHDSYAISEGDFYTGQVEAIVKWHDDTVANLHSQEAAVEAHMGKGAQYQASQLKLDKLKADSQKVDDEYTKALVTAADARQKAYDKEALSLARFQAALDKKLQAQNQQINAQVASVGMGAQEGQQYNEIANIKAQGADALYNFDNEYQGDKSSTDYKARTDAIQKNTDAMVARAKLGYTQLAQAQSSWQNGAIKGFADWAQAGKDEASLMASFTTTSFDTMSSSVLQFATTGKTSMKDMVKSILSDFEKMELRVAESKILTSILGAFMGGGASYGGGDGAATGTGSFSDFGAGSTQTTTYNATGGVYASPSLSHYSGQVVTSPTTFAFASGAGVMGEAGPEGIFPLSRGADGKLGVKASGGGGDTNITIQTSVSIDSNGQAKSDTKASGSDNKAFGKQLADELNGLIEQRLIKATQPGGLIWKQRNGQLA